MTLSAESRRHLSNPDLECPTSSGIRKGRIKGLMTTYTEYILGEFLFDLGTQRLHGLITHLLSLHLRSFD